MCTKLNQWDRALQLSNQYSVNINVNQLFDTHINQLLQKGRTLDTIKLYRKAERYLEAAELLFEVHNKFFFFNTYSSVFIIKYSLYIDRLLNFVNLS